MLALGYHYNPHWDTCIITTHTYIYTLIKFVGLRLWLQLAVTREYALLIIIIGVAVKDMIMKAINRCSGCYATITDHNEKHCEHTYVPIFFFHMTLYKLSFLGNTNRSLCCPWFFCKSLTAKLNNFIDQHL